MVLNGFLNGRLFESLVVTSLTSTPEILMNLSAHNWNPNIDCGVQQLLKSKLILCRTTEILNVRRTTEILIEIVAYKSWLLKSHWNLWRIKRMLMKFVEYKLRVPLATKKKRSEAKDRA